VTDQLPSKDALPFSWAWDHNARTWRISMVEMGDGLFAGYDHLAGYYERRLIEEIDRLQRENDTCGLQCSATMQSLMRDCNDKDITIERLRADVARLNSNTILIHGRDEFGESTSCIHTGLDLRAAIDAAMEQS
jgi:hypothetical protein